METSLASLTVVMLEKIFLCLSYEEMAQLRLVSHLFSYTYMALLNQGHPQMGSFSTGALIYCYHPQPSMAVHNQSPPQPGSSTTGDLLIQGPP